MSTVVSLVTFFLTFILSLCSSASSTEIEPYQTVSKSVYGQTHSKFVVRDKEKSSGFLPGFLAIKGRSRWLHVSTY